MLIICYAMQVQQQTSWLSYVRRWQPNTSRCSAPHSQMSRCTPVRNWQAPLISVNQKSTTVHDCQWDPMQKHKMCDLLWLKTPLGIKTHQLTLWSSWSLAIFLMNLVARRQMMWWCCTHWSPMCRTVKLFHRWKQSCLWLPPSPRT